MFGGEALPPRQQQLSGDHVTLRTNVRAALRIQLKTTAIAGETLSTRSNIIDGAVRLILEDFAHELLSVYTVVKELLGPEGFSTR